MMVGGWEEGQLREYRHAGLHRETDTATSTAAYIIVHACLYAEDSLCTTINVQTCICFMLPLHTLRRSLIVSVCTAARWDKDRAQTRHFNAILQQQCCPHNDKCCFHSRTPA